MHKQHCARACRSKQVPANLALNLNPVSGFCRTRQDLVDAWVACQSTWQYLEPVFASPDILKQMPEEGDKFLEAWPHPPCALLIGGAICTSQLQTALPHLRAQHRHLHCTGACMAAYCCRRPHAHLCGPPRLNGSEPWACNAARQRCADPACMAPAGGSVHAAGQAGRDAAASGTLTHTVLRPGRWTRCGAR